MRATVELSAQEDCNGVEFPLKVIDSDGDGLPDIVEARADNDPTGGADTDGDGLTDRFEIQRALTYHQPSKRDSDGDSTDDPDEDVDHDGLTALEEQSRQTDPVVADGDRDDLSDGDEVGRTTDPADPDTDDDGLDDGAEIRAGTDPKNSDSDGDGTPDDQDSNSATVTREGITVELTGVGDLAGALTIADMTADSRPAPGPGQAGPAQEIHLEEGVSTGLQQARVTLPYDPGLAGGEEQDLRVFSYDPTHQVWAPAGPESGQAVDTAANTVTASVDHFSVYAVFNIRNWQTTWTGLASCVTPPQDGDADVAFAIDSSGSMQWNDPENLRIAAAKEFVGAFAGHDRGAVVDFDNSFKLLQSLTTDQNSLRRALDRIDSLGGTDIGAGVRAGLDELAASPEPNRPQIMILISDGDGAYDPGLTDRAIANRVTINTIGLSSQANASLLQGIAERTGGEYHAVVAPEDLPQVFRELEDQVQETNDFDGDGLEDCDEIEGVIDSRTGERVTSDPRLRDTDGEGLTDYDEVGDRVDLPGLTIFGIPLSTYLSQSLAVHVVRSDPREPDTDEDGLNDREELKHGGDAFASDTDNDGVDDSVEAEEGTALEAADTDGDDLDDFDEILDRQALGLDPLATDRIKSPQYFRDAVHGAVCGEFCDEPGDSFAFVLGQLVFGLAPPADVRDAGANISEGDFVGAGFDLFGAIPVVGDVVKGARKVSRFAEAKPGEAEDVVASIARIENLSRADKIAALRKTIGEDRYQRLRAARITDDTLLRLAKGRTNLAWLDNAVANAAEVRVGEDGVRFFREWRNGERYLESVFRGLGAETHKRFPTSDGARFADRFLNGTAYESKVGRLGPRQSVRRQVLKDKELARTNESVNQVEWHFFPNRHGKIGPTPGLIDLLKPPPDPEIKYVIHVP